MVIQSSSYKKFKDELHCHRVMPGIPSRMEKKEKYKGRDIPSRVYHIQRFPERIILLESEVLVVF